MSHRVAKRVLGYFTLFLLSGAAASAAQIELKSTVSSPGSLVLLGDLAKITGDDAREIEQLKRLELFPAPAQGTSRVVRRGEIQELLRLNEIDLRGHHFTGATVRANRLSSPAPRASKRQAENSRSGFLTVVCRDHSVHEPRRNRATCRRIVGPTAGHHRSRPRVRQTGGGRSRLGARAKTPGRPADPNHGAPPPAVGEAKRDHQGGLSCLGSASPNGGARYPERIAGRLDRPAGLEQRSRTIHGSRRRFAARGGLRQWRSGVRPALTTSATQPQSFLG